MVQIPLFDFEVALINVADMKLSLSFLFPLR
ncbi:unnamed protein product [Fructobacillus cardui]|uniref:Uncharacterized protein n=1 Tax=Fructobacillus cardui TaxID=2893170 RepID=A0ABM9N2L0_9LACO|nr:unnamed protein product [Fructobacillus cardui]